MDIIFNNLAATLLIAQVNFSVILDFQISHDYIITAADAIIGSVL